MTDLAIAATIINRATTPENAAATRRVRPHERPGSNEQQHDGGEQPITGKVGDDQHLARAVRGGLLLVPKADQENRSTSQ